MTDHVWPIAPRTALATAVLDRLGAERGAGVVVSGEPGIGKTTLLQQVLTDGVGAALSVRGSALVADVPFGALYPHLTELADGDASSPLAVTRAVRQALPRGPDGRRPVVVVDNSPLVDEHSAHVLAGLAESGALVLAVTAVDVVDMPQSFVELWRDDLLPSVAVPPLTSEEITALVTGYLGGPVATATLHHLTETSGGNPLMLRYLVEDAVGAGTLAVHDGVWSLTAGSTVPGTRLSQLVSSRLGRWTAAERDGLELVALTERIPVSVLLSLVDSTALERLERAGVVVVDGEPEPSARIASRVVADVVRRGVPFTRRRAMREQVLAAGADLTGGPPRRLLSFALWTLESGAELEPALAVRAARAADALFDPELALRLATGVSDPEHRGEAAVLRVRSLRRMGLAANAVQVADAVLAGPLDDASRAALLAEQAAALVWVDGGAARRLPGLGGLPALVLRYAGGETEDLVEPLRALPPGPAVSALLAAVLASAGWHDDALPPLDAALAGTATADLDPEARMTALLTVAAAAVHCGRWATALDLLRGGLVGAGPEALVVGGALEAAQGLLLAVAGRTAEARTHLLSALSQARRRDPFLTTGPVLAGLALCAAREGDEASARTYLAEHGGARYAPQPAAAVMRLCLLSAQALLGDDVLDALVDAGATELAAGRRSDGLLLLGAAARRGSGSAVERLRQALLPQPGPLATAITEHASGLAESDPAALLRAAEGFAAVGDPGATADAAAAVLALPGVDREQGRTAQRLLTAARRATGRAAAPGGTSPEGLTPREQDVASRAAARLSNQEIARELHLSVRTVESYLQSAFGKLGISSRTQLRDVLATAS